VVLSWKASVPASNSPGDAIKGYIVYRSTHSNDRSAPPIHTAVVPGTTCTDDLVENGQTYFYVVRAVSQNGKASDPSNEAKAVIPKDAGPWPAPTGPFLLCREIGKER
jgi:fibronectin type 3 domain-containing protein